MKKLFIAAGFILQLSFLYSQDRQEIQKNTRNSFNKKEVTFFFAPAYSDLLNNSRQRDMYASTTGTLSYNFGFNICSRIGKTFGINYGLEFSRYQNTTVYKGVYRSDKLEVDKDGYFYYPQYETDYTEKRTILAVEIPLLFRVRSQSLTGVSYFLDLGIKTHLVALSNFRQNGTYEKKGVYPLQNTNKLFLLNENDPAYGFSASHYNVDKSMDIVKAGFSGVISGGIVGRLSDFSYLLVSPSYLYGLTDFTKKKMRDYKNTIEKTSPYTPLKLSQIALRIGIVLKV